jgi:hypothetical protein
VWFYFSSRSFQGWVKPEVQATISNHEKSRVHARLFSWLGLKNLFQTFEDLDSVKDKQVDTQAIRQLLDEDEDGQDKSEEVVC